MIGGLALPKIASCKEDQGITACDLVARGNGQSADTEGGCPQVMVANIRCKEIMSEKLEQLKDDQAWQGLCEEARANLAPELGSTMGSLMSSCLTGYDEEAQYFDLVSLE